MQPSTWNHKGFLENHFRCSNAYQANDQIIFNASSHFLHIIFKTILIPINVILRLWNFIRCPDLSSSSASAEGQMLLASLILLNLFFFLPTFFCFSKKVAKKRAPKISTADFGVGPDWAVYYCDCSSIYNGVFKSLWKTIYFKTLRILQKVQKVASTFIKPQCPERFPISRRNIHEKTYFAKCTPFCFNSASAW